MLALLNPHISPLGGDADRGVSFARSRAIQANALGGIVLQ
jgi:hypothetical protein